MAKKVLIIARDFIPYCTSLGASMRALKMAEFLHENGFEVCILCAAGNPVSYFGYEKTLKKFHIFYLKDYLQIINTDVKLKTRMHQKKERGIKKYLLQTLKTAAFKICIPDPGTLFIPKFVYQGIQLIKREKITNVIVTSPPHSTQLIGYLLKKYCKNNINLIADYRDSWNTRDLFTKKNKMADKLSCFLEKKVLQTADHFTYCSLPISKKIESKYHNIIKQSELIMNGFDASLLTRELDFPPNPFLKIGFFGNIDEQPGSYRNPSFFLKVLRELPIQAKIECYGMCYLSDHFMKKYKGLIESKGVLKHNEALLQMRKMDLLMILFSQEKDADEIITGKFFEYISARKPILIIGPENMEANRILHQYGLGYSINLFDPDDIRKKMLSIYEDWQNNRLVKYSPKTIQKFTRQEQYKKMLSILS